jgi:hypothetical protein
LALVLATLAYFAGHVAWAVMPRWATVAALALAK